MATKLFSPKQAAAEVNTTTAKVMAAIREKAIKANKIGWAWAIPAGEITKLREFVDNRKR